MVEDVYIKSPHQKAVIALGSCPASGNVFSGSPTIIGSAEAIIPVDLYVPGCPPRPQAILESYSNCCQNAREGETRSQKEAKND
jgi:Ni,Fe-hydrogenase III small subunit